MSNYTPEGLRRVAGAPLQDGESWDNEWVIAQLRAHADALDTIAKLKAHAEAMAYRLDIWAHIDECKCSEVDAYRRDFPKEEK